MAMDEREEGSQTSSCVDDVFFILKKCTGRAIKSADVDCLGAMINLVNRSLEVDYINTFQKRLMTAFSSGETKDAKVGYMVCLNF